MLDCSYLVLMGSVENCVGHIRHSCLVSVLEERLGTELGARLGLLVILQLGLEAHLDRMKYYFYDKFFIADCLL